MGSQHDRLFFVDLFNLSELQRARRTRGAHRLHLLAECRASLMPRVSTPNGHANVQLIQPVHIAMFLRTTPSSPRSIDPLGQAATHAGLSQCLQTTGSVASSATSVLCIVRTLWLTRLQATLCAWQPMQRSRSTNSFFI